MTAALHPSKQGQAAVPYRAAGAAGRHLFLLSHPTSVLHSQLGAAMGRLRVKCWSSTATQLSYTLPLNQANFVNLITFLPFSQPECNLMLCALPSHKADTVYENAARPSPKTFVIIMEAIRKGEYSNIFGFPAAPRTGGMNGVKLILIVR